MTILLGLDIGATNIRCATGSLDNGTESDSADRTGGVQTGGLRTEDITIGTRTEHQTPQVATEGAFCDEIEDIIIETLDSAGVEPDRIHAVGIGSFGPLDVATGTITKAPNIDTGLESIPIRETVASIVPGANVVLYNDATAGVLATYFAEEGVENIAYVTFSSGIGAGVVSDGTLLRGAHGNAVEVGHITLDSQASRRCGCGGTGHWEAFAGGENIPNYAAEIATEAGLDEGLLVDGGATAKTIFEAVGEDPLATETINRVGRWNALGMAALVQAYDPARIVAGGAIARNNEALVLDPIRNQLEELVLAEAPPIALTEFGDDAVLRGALVGAARELA